MGKIHSKTNAKQLPKNRTKSKNKSSTCSRCGKSPAHDHEHCLVKDAVCRRCTKRGHYQAVCRSPAKVGELHSQDDVFLGQVGNQNNNPWTVTLQLNGSPVEFCIDTGAEVTVISEATYRQVGSPKLEPPQRMLRGLDNHILPVRGLLTGQLKKGDKMATDAVYLVTGLHKPLLGRPAIEKLDLISRVGVVEDNTEKLKKQFPKLSEGLGKLQGEYKIELEPGAKPYALFTPRRVAVPLLNAVKAELQHMEELGVIAPVKEPTPWCSGMVVVPKSDSRVRICVDLTRLNESVRREKHPLPAVEPILVQLAGA